jgi:hypothetical protein
MLLAQAQQARQVIVFLLRHQVRLRPLNTSSLLAVEAAAMFQAAAVEQAVIEPQLVLLCLLGQLLLLL